MHQEIRITEDQLADVELWVFGKGGKMNFECKLVREDDPLYHLKNFQVEDDSLTLIRSLRSAAAHELFCSDQHAQQLKGSILQRLPEQIEPEV